MTVFFYFKYQKPTYYNSLTFSIHLLKFVLNIIALLYGRHSSAFPIYSLSVLRVVLTLVDPDVEKGTTFLSSKLYFLNNLIQSLVVY